MSRTLTVATALDRIEDFRSPTLHWRRAHSYEDEKTTTADMGVLDTLPDRPLLFREIEALDSELPAGFTIRPGSMLPIADTEMVPTAAVEFPDGSRTVVGYHPGEGTWIEIERWDDDEFERQEQTLAIETFADKYFAGDPLTWLDTDHAPAESP